MQVEPVSAPSGQGNPASAAQAPTATRTAQEAPGETPVAQVTPTPVIEVGGVETAGGPGAALVGADQDVELEVLPSYALYTSDLYLLGPGPARRLASSRDVGTVVQLGHLAKGTELIVALTVRDTGETFITGPASRNADNLTHARLDVLNEQTVNVSFEDLYAGGDLDYDDTVFQFRGVGASTATAASDVQAAAQVTYPRQMPDDPYVLVDEVLYPDGDALWQVRHWADPATGATWDTYREVASCDATFGEVVYTDGDRMWRVRTWHDPLALSPWMNREDLGTPAGT